MIIALLSTTMLFAQNTNETEIETIKKTRVTASDGVTENTKKVVTQKKTDLAIGEGTTYTNFKTVMKPSDISTEVFYNFDNKSYRFKKDGVNYILINNDNSDTNIARLYPTTQKGYYIMTQDGNNSLGYFNAKGDFIIESYNQDNDALTSLTYTLNNAKTKVKVKKKVQQDKMK